MGIDLDHFASLAGLSFIVKLAMELNHHVLIPVLDNEFLHKKLRDGPVVMLKRLGMNSLPELTA